MLHSANVSHPAALSSRSINSSSPTDCKDLDPIYEQLAIKYADHNITIAKINSYEHKLIGETYEVKSWPTLKFFDGSGGPPVPFQWMRDMEWMSKFIDEQLEIHPTSVVETSVVELDANSFDDIVLYSGKPAFVDFYAPFCKCTSLTCPKQPSPLTIR
jgi:thiol-disulfide isomerase/thioredoxin